MTVKWLVLESSCEFATAQGKLGKVQIQSWTQWIDCQMLGKLLSAAVTTAGGKDKSACLDRKLKMQSVLAHKACTFCLASLSLLFSNCDKIFSTFLRPFSNHLPFLLPFAPLNPDCSCFVHCLTSSSLHGQDE